MIKPLNKKIVLAHVEASKTTKSGIILTSSEEQRVSIYEVVSAYDGACVKKGQKVICSEYSGFDLEEDGTEFKIVDEDSLLAVYED